MGDLYRRYAEEIAVLGGIKSPALKRALATVRRDAFLPPGPWVIESLEGLYYQSDSADVSQVLHAVGIAIDPARMLNNANPVKVCVQLQMADLRPGETVFHVGAGHGYFTALMAELVGPEGRVYAAEIDPALHSQARDNLAPWPQVRVVGDALKSEIPPADLIYSSAGLGDIPRAWIAALKPGGRMILPITGNHDHGAVFVFRKVSPDAPLAVAVQSFTRHYPCIGTRDGAAVEALSSAFNRPVSQVSSLRLDAHAADEECWLHRDDWCLSSRQV
jgi:protein-L-isoaspartate(D-aspartate) O-methyltransferase